MMEKWNDNDRQIFINEVCEAAARINILPFQIIYKKMQEYDVQVPENYSDEMDNAIKVLAAIQKYRDVAIALKLDLVDKRDELGRLWSFAKSSFMTKDIETSEQNTVIQKEAVIKVVFPELFDKKEEAGTNVMCLESIVDNAISKFSTVSRQVALMEMQIKLGEVESKRRR